MDDLANQIKTDRSQPAIGAFGLKLFLLSLTILFGASLVGYLLIRTAAERKGTPPYGTLHLPATLWISTAAILLSSITIQTAVGAARDGRQPALRTAIVLTAVLGLVFVAIQGPSLWRLLQTHYEAAREKSIHLYGLMLMLIALHAIHVIGGLVPLGVVTVRALGGRYGRENHEGVEYCATYWHFLDVVWILLFGTLYFTG